MAIYMLDLGGVRRDKSTIVTITVVDQGVIEKRL
jgi:hypothetical protein